MKLEDRLMEGLSMETTKGILLPETPRGWTLKGKEDVSA